MEYRYYKLALRLSSLSFIAATSYTLFRWAARITQDMFSLPVLVLTIAPAAVIPLFMVYILFFGKFSYQWPCEPTTPQFKALRTDAFKAAILFGLMFLIARTV